MHRPRIAFVVIVLALVSMACSLTSTGAGTQVAPVEPVVAATTAPTIPTDTPEPEPTVEPTTSGAMIGIEQIKKATIQIEAQGSFIDPQMGEMFNAAGRGSGFIIDPEGIAVTNNHVVTGAALIKVWIGGETSPRNARVLGVSECWDLAVIDIDGSGYPYMEFHSGLVDPGLEVYAAGFPLGDPEYTLTKGIVSKAKADGESYWASVDAVIEHDARIRGGNSGGPLVDKDGRVVGINYAGNDRFDQNYAIIIKDAQPIIEKLRSGEDYESIGINGQAVMSEDGSLSGIWVSSVKSGSPADKAEVKGGDILTRMEGLVLATDGTMADYCDILRTRSPKDTLAIEVLRFASSEYMEGQLNGKTLETSFSFASELGGQVEGTGASYSNFVAVQDDYGSIQISLPTVWTEVVGEPWTSDGEIIGASITASADLQAFSDTYDEPGVFFGVSDDVAQLVGYAQLLDEYRTSFRADCTYKGRTPYKDSAFEGAYDLFTKCSGSSNTLLVLSARPQQNKTSFLVTILVNMRSDADLEALDEILRTFDVVGTLP
jgi:serine protease Do